MALWEQLPHYRGIQVMINQGVTYTVHYGKDSSGEFGSCNYEHAVDVTDPAITIAGLDISTQYYFAVSAYDNNSGLRSMCSEEVSKLTPEQELYIGNPPFKLVQSHGQRRVLQESPNDALDVMP